MMQCQGFKELMRILTSPLLALLSLLLLPLPVPSGLPCSSALCCSTTHPPLCTWEEWIFNEPIISVPSTHRNTVTMCTINTKGIWLMAKYKIKVFLSALHDLGLCPARCGTFDPAKHLSTGLTFIQIGCKGMCSELSIWLGTLWWIKPECSWFSAWMTEEICCEKFPGSE